MTDTTAIVSRCRNCENFLGDPPGKFCSACGQSTAPHTPTAGEFLHEFVGHYVALEGKLAKTLWLLFFKPGELTKQYLAGKRARYVLPLRLYLTASIIFFLLVKVLGVGNLVKVQETPDKNAKEAVSQAQTDLTKAGVAVPDGNTVSVKDLNMAATDVIRCDVGSVPCQKIKIYLDKKYANRTGREMVHEVKDRAIASAPYAMFLFVPVFALLTQLLYRRRKLYYGEHLVYAFHIHAFTFFLLIPMAFLPESVSPLIALYGTIYYFMAMRRVFGGRWWPTLLRYGVIATVYPLLLLVAMLIVFAFAVFF